jgi:SP family sugar:H+ symporter-like MFS transporter
LCILRNFTPNSEEANAAMQEIRDTLAKEKEHGQQHVKECFQGTNLRRTLLGTVMGFMTIATGVTFWFSYGTTFFAAAGIENSYLVSLILALVNATFTAPSIYLVEKAGRRMSLLVGGTIMGIAQLITAVLHSTHPGSAASQNCLVAGSVIFIAAYACSWGSIGKLQACHLRLGRDSM